MKNNLGDLANYLFEQLERLNDDEASDEEFERELKKSKASSELTKNIIEIAKISLDAQKLSYETAAEVKLLNGSYDNR